MTTPQQPVWFITAASSGFGHATALQALSLGHTVIATARSASRIQDLADAGAHTIAFDVSSPLASIESTAKDIFAKFGRVDYLVNVAGFILEGSVEETAPQEVLDSFTTNVFGVMNTVKAFLGGMRAQAMGLNGRRGTIVTFGSLGSWNGGANYAVYAMTKACVSSLAESLSAELAPFAIAATVVEPGYFRTGFLNPGARTSTALRLPAYEDASTPTGQTRRALEAMDGKQLGDVNKGAEVLVEVLTGKMNKGKEELPVRIVLGSDAVAYIRGKCERTMGLLDEWKDVAESTDYKE